MHSCTQIDPLEDDLCLTRQDQIGGASQMQNTNNFWAKNIPSAKRDIPRASTIRTQQPCHWDFIIAVRQLTW